MKSFCIAFDSLFFSMPLITRDMISCQLFTQLKTQLFYMAGNHKLFKKKKKKKKKKKITTISF
jgi:hypothetical protein